MINMPITDITVLISGEVEKPVAEPANGEDINASFLDVMVADITAPEKLLDGQVVVPAVVRVLPQALQAKVAEIPAVQTAPLPDGPIDQPAFAQFADQRLPIVAKIDLPTHSGATDLQPVLRAYSTDDVAEIPVKPPVLPNDNAKAESQPLLAAQGPEAAPHKKQQIAPDDSAAVKSVPPESIQKGTLETVVTPDQPRQIQPKPETELQLAGVEIGKALDTALRQSQRPVARAKDTTPIGAQTPLPAQDLSRPTPIDVIPKPKNTIVVPRRMNEAQPAPPAVTPGTPAPGPIAVSQPELPRMPQELPTQVTPAPQTPKSSIPNAPPVEASILDRSKRPQPATAPIVSQPIQTDSTTPVKHPQPTDAPMALLRDPVLPAATASQPLLAQVINSPAPLQPKEVKITPSPSAQITMHAPNTTPPQPTSSDIPIPPLPAVETALPEMVEPLDTPDLFPVETRPTDSTGTRLDAITTRPEMARHVAQQLAEVARQMPDRPIELTLNPEELGRVRLTFTMSDGGISVAVIAERGETMDLLRRHIDTLAQEFRDMGYKDVNFEFSRNGQGDAGGGDANHDRSANSDTPSTETEALAPVQLSLEPSTGLDLRL